MGSWILRILLFLVCGISGYALTQGISPSPPIGWRRAGERRRVFVGHPSPRSPTRSSRGEDGELDAALGAPSGSS